MKASLHKNMWKIEILTGKYPAKTFAYKFFYMRQEILSLFHILDKISFLKLTRKDVIEALSSYPYIIDNIYESVILVNKFTSNKVNINYEKNNKFKFDIISDGNLITIKIPIEDYTPF